MLTRRMFASLGLALALLPIRAPAAPYRMVGLPSGAIGIDSGTGTPAAPAAPAVVTPPVDTLRLRASLLDSLLIVRTAFLARSESTLARMRDDSAVAEASRRADSSRIAVLRDSLARFMIFDSLAIRIDSLAAGDSTLEPRLPELRALLGRAALGAGLTIHQHEEIAGFARCPVVRARLWQRGDSTWIRIERGNRAFQDSTSGIGVERIALLQRTIVRRAFGAASIPPEPVAALWPWPVRAGILGGAALLSLLTAVFLW